MKSHARAVNSGEYTDDFFFRFSNTEGDLIWSGYEFPLDSSDHFIAFSFSDEQLNIMNQTWPGLENMRQWVDTICPPGGVLENLPWLRPWEVDSLQYIRKMKELMENIRITILYNNKLVVSTGGYEDVVDPNGQLYFHTRGKNTHSTNLAKG